MGINHRSRRTLGAVALLLALLLLPAGCREQEAACTQDCVLSFQAGSTTAVRSGTRTDGSEMAGEEIPLAAAPQVEGEVFWLPLEDLAAALGATCQLDGDTAAVHWLDQEVVYTAGTPGARWNGSDWQPQDAPAFRDPQATLSPEEGVPQVRDGVWYLPLAYVQPLLYGGTLWTQPTQDPGTGVVILGREMAGDLTLGGFSLAGRPRWEDLPAALTQGMAETQRRPSGDGLSEGVCRSRDGVSCWVLQALPQGPAIPEEGVLCGVELTTREEATPRGLRVGDSLDRARLLYGPLEDLGDGRYRRAEPFALAFKLCLEVQGETITKIGLYNNLWTMG